MQKVMLLMSGGVDSSVAAVFLKNQGYEVVGVTMKLHSNQDNRVQKEINDAKSVAKKLNIEHIVIDLCKDFEDIVIKNFVDEYLLGRTPNPCVVCNKYIKFGKMFELSKSMGFDYIATGHYAVISYDKDNAEWILKKSNSSKDQSYVLYNLDQEKLSRTLLPLAGLEKKEIRKIAQENNLFVANKKDSQEICFVEDNDYCKFIESYTKITPPRGNFVDLNGGFLGKHQGLIHYTVGQRRGLGISFGKAKYVVLLDAVNNEVVLGDEEDQYSSELIADNVNFIFPRLVGKEFDVNVKIRYKADGAKARIVPIDENKVKVIFYKKQKSVTPGQSVVFYDGDVVMGGGIIKKANR